MTLHLLTIPLLVEVDQPAVLSGISGDRIWFFDLKLESFASPFGEAK